MGSFLEQSELQDAYTAAQRVAKQHHAPFNEYERIADNLPSSALPPEYPKITSGHTSALINETPMRVWGQLQTGRVVALNNPVESFEDWKTETVNVTWQNYIVPNANSQAPFFSKLQIAMHKSIIYGSQPAYIIKRSDSYYTGADFILPNVRNVFYEPGKTSDTDSDYVWINHHYTKLQLRRLIATAKKRKGHDGWDLEELAKLLDSNAFAAQPDDSVSTGAVTDFTKVVTFSTCFQRGVGSKFYTIYHSNGGVEAGKTLRVWTNDDPTGDIPIRTMYNQRNLTDPYGVSQVALLGPTQNLIDFLTAAHARVTEKGVDPPVKISGDETADNINVDSIVDEPGALWEVGRGNADYVNNTNQTHAQMPQIIGMYTTNIQNLQGTSTAEVAAGDSGDSRFSKTPAGVKYQQERTNARDNYLRQRADEFVASLAKGLINTTIQMTSGARIIEVTDEQRDRLIAAGKEVPQDKKTILVEFESLKKGEFKYDVDANSSILKNDDATKDRMVELLTSLLNVPNLDQIMAADEKEIHLAELVQGIVAASGLDHPEKIITELSEEKRNQLALLNTPQETEAIEGEVIDDDTRLAEQLKADGWDDEQIAAYLQRMEGK